MAFPTSPTDGQVYNSYTYNSAEAVWKFNNIDFSQNIKIQNLDVGSGVGGVETGGGIYFENNKHTINNNDGSGDFNIRVGNVNDTINGQICSEAGYVGHIEFSQTAGLLSFENSSQSYSVNDAVSFVQQIKINPDGIGIYATPNTSVTYGLNTAGNVRLKNNAINYGSQFHCTNNGKGDLRITTSTGALPGYPNDNYPVVKTNGGALYFSVDGTYSAYMLTNGSITAQSSKEKKHNFVDITYEDYFDKMSRIEVQQYEYINDVEAGDQKYIGPYAEDMKAEFDLGTGEMLSDKDTAGVALLGVKHLLDKIDNLKQRINELEAI